MDNPETRNNPRYTGKIRASKIIGKLIEISLELWNTRNSELHGLAPAEERQIQRVRAIQVVTKNMQRE